MIATHNFTLTATCPVDGSRDVYEVSVKVGYLVKCEDIVAAAETISKESPVFQEELTEKLARKIPHSTVTTSGHHRCGVFLTVICEDDS